MTILAQSEDAFDLPAEKTLLVQSLCRLCCLSQALEPSQEAYQLATRLRGVFLTYIVELGMKALEDRPVEVCIRFFSLCTFAFVALAVHVL